MVGGNEERSVDVRRDSEEEEDSDDEIWEEVTPETALQIDLSAVVETRPTKKRRSGFKKEDRVKRIELHKAHLLTLLAHCIHRNLSCNIAELQSVMFSRVPRDILEKLNRKALRLELLKELIHAWRDQINVLPFNSNKEQGTTTDFIDMVELVLSSGNVSGDHLVHALCFESVLRTIGFTSRLVASLHPVPLSLASSALASADPFLPVRLWSEVFLGDTWIPIDISRNLINDLKSMEPPASSSKQEQFAYIIALEPTFGIRDVTRRYTSQWGAKTSKLRLPSPHDEWWTRTLWLYSKSHSNEADAVDESLQNASMNNEKMPTSFQGFVNHPLFALERHLKKNEIIYPSGKEHSIGVFRNELVYKREQVHKLQSRIAWLREGRDIEADQTPIKTQAKRNSMENTENENGEGSVIELFGPWQTKKLTRPVLQDGVIPCNRHGNIEIFHPRMIPVGTTHVIIPGVDSLARDLQIHFRKVVTGFEFAQGKARPRYEGIVVLSEFAELLKEAAIEHNEAKQSKLKEQRHTLAMSRWKKFVIALLNRERLMREYAS